jgi:hypothetical protein
METTNQILVPEHYNPNQIVTYKVIQNGDISYPTAKVVDIEYAMELGRTAQRALNDRVAQIRQLEGELESWLENANDADTIVSEICQIFGFNPEKEIQFEASATITGTVRVPLSQLSEFDIDDLDLTVYADAHGYDVDLDVEVDNIYKV